KVLLLMYFLTLLMYPWLIFCIISLFAEFNFILSIVDIGSTFTDVPDIKAPSKWGISSTWVFSSTTSIFSSSHTCSIYFLVIPNRTVPFGAVYILSPFTKNILDLLPSVTYPLLLTNKASKAPFFSNSLLTFSLKELC